MKIKKFNIKPDVIRFSSSQYMTDLEKARIYINFVSFLNNHFKKTTFKKNLYEHFHLHCGFIAHYNIHGFYAEYFDTAALFHKLDSNYDSSTEYSGYIKVKDGLTKSQAFKNIFNEINSSNGLGFFINQVKNSNLNYYEDLNKALKEKIDEYINIFNNLIDAEKESNKNEDLVFYKTDNLKEKINKKQEIVNDESLYTQLSLF